MILRSSDETASILPTPDKQMVQVTNPFALEMGSGLASVTGENSRKAQGGGSRSLRPLLPVRHALVGREWRKAMFYVL